MAHESLVSDEAGLPRVAVLLNPRRGEDGDLADAWALARGWSGPVCKDRKADRCYVVFKHEVGIAVDEVSTCPPQFQTENEVMDDLPVVCTLTPDAIAARKAQLLPGLVRRAQDSEDIENGVRFWLSSGSWPALAAAIDAERRCCRFLRVDIDMEPNEGPIVMTLSGPPGTREFLRALLDS